MALGLTEGAEDETKARYAFVFGDFRRIHRSGVMRATTALPSGGTRRSNWRHTTCCSFLTRRAPDGERAGHLNCRLNTVSRAGRALLEPKQLRAPR